MPAVAKALTSKADGHHTSVLLEEELDPSVEHLAEIVGCCWCTYTSATTESAMRRASGSCAFQFWYASLKVSNATTVDASMPASIMAANGRHVACGVLALLCGGGFEHVSQNLDESRAASVRGDLI